MPSFFTFQQGTESRARPSADASPLLGRFRAMPSGGQRRPSLLAAKRDRLLASISGSMGYGYGTLLFGTAGDAGESGSSVEDGADENEGWLWRSLRDVWIHPRQGAVRRVVERWWWRWSVLVVLPAAIVRFSLYIYLALFFLFLCNPTLGLKGFLPGGGSESRIEGEERC